MNCCDSIRRRIAHGAVAAAVGFAAAPALAAPASGPDSLAGYWRNTAVPTVVAGPVAGGAPSLRTSNGDKIPLLPDVAKVVAERLKGHTADGRLFERLSQRCLTEGMPAAAAPPVEHPLEILEQPEQVTVLLEYFRIIRTIRMNVDHPEDPDPLFMGDSIGHWDHGALVVDTIAINDRTNILGVIPHSDQLHVVERIRRTGANTMEDRVTLDDPKTFSKPFTMVSRFKKEPIRNLGEFVCLNVR